MVSTTRRKGTDDIGHLDEMDEMDKSEFVISPKDGETFDIICSTGESEQETPLMMR